MAKSPRPPYRPNVMKVTVEVTQVLHGVLRETDLAAVAEHITTQVTGPVKVNLIDITLAVTKIDVDPRW